MGIFRKKQPADKFLSQRQDAYDLGEWELRSTRQQLEDFHSSFTIFETDKKLIRVGEPSDGGYLIPDDLEGICAIFSPGVAAIAKFEEYFADRGITCFLADASVEAPPSDHDNFRFIKKFVHARPSAGDYINFEDWVTENSKEDEDLVLQMDIEGAEWEILEHVDPKVLRRFRILVFELHGMHQIAYKIAFETINRIFSKLTLDFEIVHIHPNNAERALNAYDFTLAPLLEVTLLRKDRIKKQSPVKRLPHGLDWDNVNFYPTTGLDARWLSTKS